MKINKKNLVSFFNHLKGVGVSCGVTLIPLNERFENESYKNILTQYIYTDIDNLPMDIIDSDKNYEIRIYNHEYHYGSHRIINNRTYYNRKSFLDKIEKDITDRYPDHVTNHKRKTRLDDILNDTSPLILI